MYRRGKAYCHSNYIRPDRVEIFKFAKRVADQEGQSLSRFVTNIVYDYLVGRLQYAKRKAS